jgi:histidine triad (HIT) family protein
MASIFTRIIAGELPGHFVWKDDLAVAFMTIQPAREGHLLVVPRDEIDHWDDLPPALATHLMLISQRIAHALKDCYRSRRVGMLIAGLEVPHTHLHVVPLNSMADISLANSRMASADNLHAAALKIRAALRARGCREAEF